MVFKVYVDVVTVALCTASLNVAVIEEATGKPVAALAGLVLVTVGGVVSDAPAVVNDQILAVVMALPAISLTPVVRVAV